MSIDHITGWLYRVTRNRITDLFRARRPETLDVSDLLPSPDAGPEAEYVRVLLLEALERAIGELPPEQRDVFVLYEESGLTLEEIGRITGVAMETAKSRLRYAVGKLRTALRQHRPRQLEPSVQS
jgi:RNA polymerase sigma factor (sigma-70 family)